MKEIKIMARADFAGDVALWIFFMMCTFIYTYTFLRIYIYIYIYHHYHYHYGPLFDYLLVVLPRVGYGRALICLRGRP